MLSHGQTEFITTWKTDNSGTSNSTSISIPTIDTTHNYDVDWDNDGNFDTLGVTGSITHDFGFAGIYTIRIRGDFPHIYFNDEGDKRKILTVDQWGSIAWTSMNSAFLGCTNLVINATDAPDLSGVTDMALMFGFADSLDHDLNNWDVSNITDMSGLFFFAKKFDQDLGD